MDAYHRFLKRTATVCLVVVLLLSAGVGILTYPTVSVLGNGSDETALVNTLSILLAGFCFTRLLFALWDRELTLRTGALTGLGILVSLSVLPIREQLPFVLKGYVFPLMTGLAVPRLLLSLLPNTKPRRLDRLLALLCGLVIALLSGVTLYGSLHADSLSGALICRLTALPLLWFAPLFGHYAKRCQWGDVFLDLGLGILPLFAVCGILWEAAFALFPSGILLTGGGLLADVLLRRKTQRTDKI
jgi:hypothetical protein